MERVQPVQRDEWFNGGNLDEASLLLGGQGGLKGPLVTADALMAMSCHACSPRGDAGGNVLEFPFP
jgi:hypothetical protein